MVDVCIHAHAHTHMHTHKITPDKKRPKTVFSNYKIKEKTHLNMTDSVHMGLVT